MRFLRTNTAVLVTVGPFFDKADGVTLKTALTITNEKITLTADTDDGNAPTLILDNVTGATSGTSNDLNYITDNDAALMQLELSAANTNRLGRMRLTITDAANHVPVWEDFIVLPAMIYDAFIAGTDVLQADVTQLLGTAWLTPATAGTPDVNTKTLTDGAITAAKLGANAINAAKLDPDVTTELQSGLATAAALTTAQGDLDTLVASIDATGAGDLDALLALLATRPEPGQGSPAATATFMAKVDYLYKAWRNRSTQHQTNGYKLYNDDATTVDQKATATDDGTTRDRGEIVTGP